MAKVVVSLNREWFRKNEQKFIDAANDTCEDEKYLNKEYTIYLDIDPDEYQIRDDGAIVCMGGTKGHATNWVRIEFNPDIEELINLSAVVVKYYNKMKSALESIKSV